MESFGTHEATRQLLVVPKCQCLANDAMISHIFSISFPYQYLANKTKISHIFPYLYHPFLYFQHSTARVFTTIFSSAPFSIGFHTILPTIFPLVAESPNDHIARPYFVMSQCTQVVDQGKLNKVTQHIISDDGRFLIKLHLATYGYITPFYMGSE